MFLHDCPLAPKPASTPRRLLHKKILERISTYRYAPFCCVCLGCCVAEFESSGGTYKLPCIRVSTIILNFSVYQTPARCTGEMSYVVFQFFRQKNIRHKKNRKNRLECGVLHASVTPCISVSKPRSGYPLSFHNVNLNTFLPAFYTKFLKISYFLQWGNKT